MPFHPTLSERLARDFPIRRDERDAQCLATYPLFLKFFKERIAVADVQLSDAKIAVVLVFTWLQGREFAPECWAHFPAAKRMLERDKAGRLSAIEINALKAFCGGSLIATSNFLHLANPSRYAMWDTNIARAAYRYTWHQCNQAERYVAYLEDIKALRLDAALRDRVRLAIGRAGALRERQFALSQLGIAESAPASGASHQEDADLPYTAERFTVDLGVEDDAGL